MVNANNKNQVVNSNSKYAQMVDSIVNLGHGDVLVTNFKRDPRTSKKTGRQYYVYMVELEQSLWVTTTQFKNGTYCKKLNKIREEKYGRKLTVRETTRKMSNEDFLNQQVNIWFEKLLNDTHEQYTPNFVPKDLNATKNAKTQRKWQLINMAYVKAWELIENIA